jgi:xanthine dehydrogenase accessory factor
MLLYVIESKGSSPGRQGFFMAVSVGDDPASFRMQGSIGGGIMEHKFVEMAKEKLRSGITEPGVKKQVHDKSAATNQSGMICSGEQTIFLYPVRHSDAGTIKRIISSLKQKMNGTLILSPDGIMFTEAASSFDHEYHFNREDDWLYKEKTGYKNKLFIIGGGHCSLALSNLMSQMDFYVSVYDDREGLKTMEANETAHEKHLLNDYAELATLLNSADNHYVVIMTFGYRTDDIALKTLLDKRFRYLGVLGSKKKMETLFENYRKEGISDSILQRIHTPIGLDISSQTPEEIAVSIAAELIKVKNQQP